MEVVTIHHHHNQGEKAAVESSKSVSGHYVKGPRSEVSVLGFKKQIKLVSHVKAILKMKFDFLEKVVAIDTIVRKVEETVQFS